jgi:urea transport system substrate-binding protein
MKRIYIISSLLIIGILLFYLFEYTHLTQDTTIKVGVLFSETGTMAESEQPVIRSTLLAIEQINQQGGINGKQIIPIFYDTQSDWKNYAQLAKKLILKDHVNVIFGCWTSASRKEVKPIVEKYNNLLIYPSPSEGIEESNNIIYLGSTSNQQLVPAASWMFDHYGKKAYLVGSEYIFPYVANEILSHEATILNGKIVGTSYIPFGSMNVDNVINDIIKKNPDFIFNTINGSTNTAFFNRLYDLTTAVGRKRPRVMSFSLSAGEMISSGMDKMVGDLTTSSYFQIQANPKNQEFLKAYKEKYGSTKNINAPTINAYAGVYLWKQALSESPSLEGGVVHDFMLRQSIASPAGVIYIDPYNSHAWRKIIIGQINHKKTYDFVWTSYTPIQPSVFPDFKTKAEWAFFEYKLYMKWNKSWGKT